MRILNLPKAIIKREYYVIVFDLCSSSNILEAIQKKDKLRVWRKFWKKTYNYLFKISASQSKCIIYKFVGDGFILLYRPRYKKKIISFCEKIKNYMNKEINLIIKDYLRDYSGRTGITIGIDKGKLIKMMLHGKAEYMGKPINVASRLQSLLKLPENANKILVTKNLQSEIKDQLKNKDYKEKIEVLHNLYDNKEIPCIEIEI